MNDLSESRIEDLEKNDVGAQTAPVQLSLEDRLIAENLHLRLMNVSMQEQNLTQEISRMRTEREELQRKLLVHRDEVAKKYGIDFEKSEIRAGDGMVVARSSTRPGFLK